MPPVMKMPTVVKMMTLRVLVVVTMDMDIGGEESSQISPDFGMDKKAGFGEGNHQSTVQERPGALVEYLLFLRDILMISASTDSIGAAICCWSYQEWKLSLLFQNLGCFRILVVKETISRCLWKVIDYIHYIQRPLISWCLFVVGGVASSFAIHGWSLWSWLVVALTLIIFKLMIFVDMQARDDSS